MKKKQRKQKQKQRQNQRHVPDSTSPPVRPEREDALQAEKSCLWTLTGEIFQPIRVYYKLTRRQAVIDAFLHLQCMECVPSQERWVWLYRDEAQSVPFSRSAATFGEAPVVLGSVYFKGSRLMYLDVGSYQRALAAIPFFDRYVERNAAKVTHLGMSTRLFGEDDRETVCFDDYFRTDGRFNDHTLKMIAKLFWLKIRTRNVQKRMELLETFIKKELDKPEQDVDYVAIRYYKEGLQQLHFILSSRQQIAIQRWQGNEQYSQADYFQELAQRIFANENIEAQSSYSE